MMMLLSTFSSILFSLILVHTVLLLMRHILCMHVPMCRVDILVQEKAKLAGELESAQAEKNDELGKLK